MDMKKQHSVKTNSSSNILRRSDTSKKISVEKRRGLESNRSIEVYKCGCKELPVKSMVSVREPQGTKLLKKNKLSFNKSQQLLEVKPASVPNNSGQFKQLIRTLNTLKKQFKSLQKQTSHTSVEIIQSVPREVITSVDTIKRVERPVERVIKKVVKVPKEILVYSTVNKDVVVEKEELVFVDSEATEPVIQNVEVVTEVVRTVPVLSNSNERMRQDLGMFQYRSQQILAMIEDSHTTISQLRSNIRNLQISYQNPYPPHTLHHIPSHQDLPHPLPIKPQTQHLIRSPQILTTSFLTSMVSITSNLCGQIYQKNPQDMIHDSSKPEDSYCSESTVYCASSGNLLRSPKE